MRLHSLTLLNSKTQPQGLDYIRTKGLLDINAGKDLPGDIPGPNNDILDSLDPILSAAIAQKARMYVFGSSYGTGIHDVHMNQGSLPQFENWVYEDGALLFEFADRHWEAVLCIDLGHAVFLARSGGVGWKAEELQPWWSGSL